MTILSILHTQKFISLKETLNFFFKKKKLLVLNQLLLPHETVYENVETSEEGWNQIRTMKVRGAPAIAIVATLSLAVELYHLKKSSGSAKKKKEFSDRKDLFDFIVAKWEYLKTSRPTAVNLFDAATKFVSFMKKELDESPNQSVDAMIDVYLTYAQEFLKNDIQDNLNIGKVFYLFYFILFYFFKQEKKKIFFLKKSTEENFYLSCVLIQMVC